MNKLLKNFCFTAAAVAIVANSFAFTACGHEHTAGESVRENIVAASCTQSGSYDEVVYCADCNEEISRTQKTIAQTAHTPSIEVIKENEAPATCAKEGSYDEVIKCVDCGGEASRKHKTIEKLPHSYAETYSKDATGMSALSVAIKMVLRHIFRERKQPKQLRKSVRFASMYWLRPLIILTLSLLLRKKRRSALTQEISHIIPANAASGLPMNRLRIK